MKTMSQEAARRSVVMLCMLIVVFAGLGIIVKQWAIVPWAGMIIAALAGFAIATTNYLVTTNRIRAGHLTPARMLVVAGIVVVPSIIAVVIGSVIESR